MRPYRLGALALLLTWWGASTAGQSTSYGESQTSWTFETYTPGPCSPTGARHGGCNPGDAVRIAVTTVASGLVQPWHITFLPGTSDVLVTELPGRLRIIRNGVLDPAPVPGWPTPSIPSRSLHSLVLHPRFADNRTVYLTYVKSKDAQTRTPTTVAIARARFDGKVLSAIEQIYNSNHVSEQPWWRPGMEMPVMFWAPAISPSSILIYTGDRFPKWKGHFFIGALSGQQLQRVAFNQPGPQTERRESMLVPLDARFRDVRQAPDGTIYVAVERDTQLGPGSTKLTPTGSILKIAPAD